jgi:hypothetical protein
MILLIQEARQDITCHESSPRNGYFPSSIEHHGRLSLLALGTDDIAYKRCITPLRGGFYVGLGTGSTGWNMGWNFFNIPTAINNYM